MSDPLEIKKLRVDMKRVEAAREEMELKIEEKLLEIERLKQNITIQQTREAELAKKIEELSK